MADKQQQVLSHGSEGYRVLDVGTGSFDAWWTPSSWRAIVHSNLIKENEEPQRPLNPIHMGSSLMTLTLSPLKGYTSLAVPWD